MSVEAMAWAWKQGDLNDGEKLTLMALADHAHDDGVCWPSNGLLAKKLGVSDRAVRGRIEKLEAKGLLRREERQRDNGSQTSNLVVLAVPGSDVPPGSYVPGTPGSQASAPEPPEGKGSSSRGSDKSNGKKHVGQQETLEGMKGSGPPPTKPKVSVDGKPLVAEEWQVASRAIEVFNECNGSRLALLGTRGGGTEALKRIVMRVREHPELTPDDHERIVRNGFKNRWWPEEKAGGVGVIYGPNAFDRAIANSGRKRVQRRRFSAERDPSEIPSDPKSGW